jgi:hypothetical protein
VAVASFAPNIEHMLIIMSDDKKVKTWKFQGHHTGQTYYKSGIISPDYLCGEPTQRLDRIVAYVMIIVKIVGNGANGRDPHGN